jgi:hypothetical protein
VAKRRFTRRDFVKVGAGGAVAFFKKGGARFGQPGMDDQGFID